MEDALLVAVATIFEMDFLLSWNYKHLANVRKETRVQAVNLQLGYLRTPRMATPLEVSSEDE